MTTTGSFAPRVPGGACALSTLPSRAAEQTFVADFLERLYRAKASRREALLVVVDEADVFAPQRPGAEQARSLGAMEAIVRRGRIRGLGCLLISQRAAVASLERGEAWVWSPAWLRTLRRVRIRQRTTFDSSRTPEAGEAAAAPRALAKVDIPALSARLAAAVEQAKADDPRALRRRIAELEQQVRLQADVIAAGPQTVTERVEVPVLGDEQLRRLEEAVSRLTTVAMEAAGIGKDIGSIASEVVSAIAEVRPTPGEGRVPVGSRGVPSGGATAPRAAGGDVHTVAATRPVAAARPVSESGEASLKAGARRILKALARHHPLVLTRAQVGTLTGFRITGGTFTTYWSTLRRAGYIEEVGGEVRVTDAGLAAAGTVASTPATTDEMLELWRGVLKAGARAMLDVLVASYPEGMTRAELAERTDMTATGGTFTTYLSTLRRNGLTTVEGEQVRASDTLFISGVR